MADQNAKTKKIFDGRYEIISIVGRGAKSVVYRAKLISAPYSEVALKVLVDQKGKNPSSERLRREALAMVSCRHRYVARLDDFHSLGSLCYLAMEYAPSSDLRSYIKNFSNKLPLDLAERFFKQAAEGLSFVHRAGIIHRDLKPENILVINDKEIRITDFGVALLPGEECSIAELQSGIGTMNYMAPEIIEGRPTDNRADIYALGVVFYELISGSNPFQSAPLAKQIEIRKSEKFPKLNQLDPTVPKYLSDLIHQCMRYDLDERFSSCDQLLTSILNKKSEDFSNRQKVIRAKPSRPKTNNFHKRKKKVLADSAKTNLKEKSSMQATSKQSSDTLSQEDSDLFEEFNKIINAAEVSEKQEIESGADTSEESITSEQSVFNQEDNIVEEESEQQSEEDLEGLKESELNEDSNYPEPSSSNNPTTFFQSANSSQNQSSKLIPGLLKIAFVIAIIIGVGRILITLFSIGMDHFSSWGQKELGLPVFEAEQVSFPNLPQGVYSGYIKGLFSEAEVALTLISFEEQKKIAILLGVKGWQPQFVDISELEQDSTLIVKSNGIVLELKGEFSSGRISGFYKSLISGTQGEWSVEPAV